MKYYVLNQDEYKAKYNEGSFFYNDITGHIEGDGNVNGNCMFDKFINGDDEEDDEDDDEKKKASKKFKKAKSKK